MLFESRSAPPAKNLALPTLWKVSSEWSRVKVLSDPTLWSCLLLTDADGRSLALQLIYAIQGQGVAIQLPSRHGNGTLFGDLGALSARFDSY